MEKKQKTGMVSTLASFITTFGVLPFIPTEANEARIVTAIVALGLYAVGLHFLAPYLDKSTNNSKLVKKRLLKQ